MRKVVLFDTMAEAEAGQAADLIKHLSRSTNPKYKEQTVKWAIPERRRDGKFDYGVCPGNTYREGSTKTYDKSDYDRIEHDESNRDIGVR